MTNEDTNLDLVIECNDDLKNVNNIFKNIFRFHNNVTPSTFTFNLITLKSERLL